MPQSDDAPLLNAVLPEWVTLAERRGWRWLRFPRELERIFVRYYDIRFRRWVQVASCVLAAVYTIRIASQYILYGTTMTLPLFYSGLVMVSVIIPWAHFVLTFTRVPLERLTWLFMVGMLSMLSLVQLFNQQLLNRGEVSPFILPTYQAMLIAPVGLRLRFWRSLPFVILIAFAPLFLSFPFDEDFRALLVVQVLGAMTFALMLNYLLELDARQDFINRVLIQHMASIDALTGLFNRRHFFERAQAEIQRAHRYRHTLSIIIFDIDFFKRLNDMCGHQAGDRALRAVAQTSRQQLRATDILGRLGGEEFAILLPETSLANAAQLAERLRLALTHLVLNNGSQQFQLTASFGVSAWDAADENLDAMLHRADSEMYRAKQMGRNQVCVSEKTQSSK